MTIPESLFTFAYGFLTVMVAFAISRVVGLDQASDGIWIMYWLCVMVAFIVSRTYVRSWFFRTAPKPPRT